MLEELEGVVLKQHYVGLVRAAALGGGVARAEGPLHRPHLGELQRVGRAAIHPSVPHL